MLIEKQEFMRDEPENCQPSSIIETLEKRITESTKHADNNQINLLPQNCGTCYELTCPTNERCGKCGILKAFPMWRRAAWL